MSKILDFPTTQNRSVLVFQSAAFEIMPFIFYNVRLTGVPGALLTLDIFRDICDNLLHYKKASTVTFINTSGCIDLTWDGYMEVKQCETA